ncbi:MAG: chemotaxis protein CheW [Burkholderiales bacterium]
MAKRFSLREFQQGLSARLQAAADAPAGAASKLGVQSGRDLWLVDLFEAGEVVTLPELTPVPLTRPWFSGVANIRGVLYSIVDFSAFTGGEPIQHGLDTRVLLVGQKLATNCGLLVNRMMGLRRPEQLKRADGVTSAPWISAEYLDNDGRRWKELNLRKLVEHPGFLQIGV